VKVTCFVLHCIDAEGTAQLRARHRPAHLEHIRGSGVVRIAGPLLNENEAMIGSLIIIEVADMEAARAFSEADPFKREGVFGSVEIRRFSFSYTDLRTEGGTA
jgi:uncharacterized protein YciI